MVTIIIDFHAHILPGTDHGCKDVTTSLKQLEMAHRAKVDVVIATPHFYPHCDSVESFLQRRELAVQMLKEHNLDECPIMYLGSEVLLCKGMEKMNDLDKLCIENTNCLLLEMPIGDWENALIRTLKKLKDSQRFHLILAHVDRYTHAQVQLLKEIGLDMQLNAKSMMNWFRRPLLKKLVKEGRVWALGSDIHGTTNEYKKLLKAMKYLKQYQSGIMERSQSLLYVAKRGEVNEKRK